MSRFSRVLVVVALCLVSVCAWPTVPTAMLMVKMSDGTELATDYYLPAQGGPAWPAIVARSAYPKDLARWHVDHFLNNGYVAVVQDIRGRGMSKGAPDIFYADGWRADQHDGADTIAWVKAQPWCNGKIGTFGESALGMTQVLLAPTTKDVVCQFIEIAPSDFYHNVAYRGGVWCKNLSEGWMTLLGMRDIMDMYKGRPTYEAFWTFYNAEAKAPEVTAPAVHVGCWYDIFQQGTINNFVTRQSQGGPGAKGNQKLIMRGGSHIGYDSRDYKYKDNRGAVNTGAIREQFFAHWLKGEANGVMDIPAVQYYVLGDDTDPDAPGNEWRSATMWPPVPTVETPYYFAPDGLLSTAPPAAPGKAAFQYDPRNPFPTHGGANLLLPAGPFDQRAVNKDRTDLLRFASAPLTAPVEVTGRVFVRLFVSTDAPDTDLTAKLLDVYPEGDAREILILDSIQRVKFRNGYERPAPLLTSSDEVVEVRVDLWSVSCVFNTRHRIGLQVSSSNYPRFEVNPNTGDDFPKEGQTRVAANVVHMGPARPSAALLPVRQ